MEVDFDGDPIVHVLTVVAFIEIHVLIGFAVEAQLLRHQLCGISHGNGCHRME
jgi:hypothetical protein